MKKVLRIIKFNQKAWLKPYIYMNTDPRKKAEYGLEKDFFKLMKNAIFGKTKENATKHRDIKLITTEARRNHLVSEPNCHTTKLFSENLLAIEMRKTQTIMNKPVYSGLSILELSKIVMHKFQYNYIKPKYCENTKRYMDTDSFTVYVNTDDIYKYIAEDVENTSNSELNRPLPKGKNKKIIGVVKDNQGEKS